MPKHGARQLPAGQTVSEETLHEIVQRILAVDRPERVIVFGSAATGQMTVDSDIDLLVVERQAPDPRGQSLKIHQALRGLPYAFDVMVMTLERFEETRDVIGGIAWPASRYGKVIYEAAG